MLDLLERVRNERKITYVFFNTGIEYRATLKHLDYLEEKYDIEIIRRKAKVPVPVGCKKYGLPFLSKAISQKIERLQKHNFTWEDKPLEELLEDYPNCKAGVKWWTDNFGERSQFSVLRNKGLKEYMLNIPPDFSISDRCCNGAKKDTAKEFLKEQNCMLQITGERRAEGGLRATSHHSCFEPLNHSGVPKYMPLFFWTDADKQQYKKHYGLQFSDCYEVYGMKRTGCAGCPFNSKFDEEMEIIKKYEPELYLAVNNIFGKSYEYTRAYRKFRDEYKRKEREEKKNK